MTEDDYILASDTARILDAQKILREVMPSQRVPEAQYREVMKTIGAWEDATFAAIHRRREETTAAASAQAVDSWVEEQVNRLQKSKWDRQACEQLGFRLGQDVFAGKVHSFHAKEALRRVIEHMGRMPTDKPVVHVLWSGRPICGFHGGAPDGWPAGHRWVRVEESKDATCEACVCRAHEFMPKAGPRP